MDNEAAFLQNLSTCPGVYQMLNMQDKVLYVGKARNLKKRVASYFRSHLDSAKTRALMSQVDHIDIVITATENEALLLECNLIKKHRPRYNILLRDDKSYPSIFISHDTFPRIVFHRGSQREKGQYFGPYSSVSAVRDTLNLLQKLFPVRQCANSFYQNRTRPCLQYQIKRCLAPCVGFADEKLYTHYVSYAKLFLSGKDSQVIDVLTKKMDEASSALHYEDAVFYRDKINKLRQVQAKQCVSNVRSDADVFSVLAQHGATCVQVLTLRQGKLLANQAYYPRVPAGSELPDIMLAFISQYYLSSGRHLDIPPVILSNVEMSDKACLQETLSERAQKKVRLLHRVRGERVQWLKSALLNAKESLARHVNAERHIRQRFTALQTVLDLAASPERIECFDVSHTSGDLTVAACVVFDHGGPRKSDYRRYNITGVIPSDDYAAMRLALKRRYTKIKFSEAILPDILLIDGGKGQLKQAVEVFKELEIEHVILLAISKGRARRPGLESLHMPNKPSFTLPPDSDALHLLQRIRDEAHHFAITGHKARRKKAQNRSILEEIPGVGPKKRRDLLRYFGGLQGLEKAGVKEITQVTGIGAQLAQTIFDLLHDQI